MVNLISLPIRIQNKEINLFTFGSVKSNVSGGGKQNGAKAPVSENNKTRTRKEVTK